MKYMKFFCSLSIVLMFTIVGCSKDDAGSNVELINPSSLNSERINKFIIDAVHEAYLWEAEINWNIYGNNFDYSSYSDHYKLFDELVYKDDRWSSLVNNIDSMENVFGGISTTFGYTLQFYYNPFANDNSIIAVVLYTSAGSSAEKAGIKRGDIIVEINGSVINITNYLNLYYTSSLEYRCGIVNISDRTISPFGEAKRIFAVEMYENPIQEVKIIEIDSRKIGYLCYTSYQIDSEQDLLNVFHDFKAAGVTDVVLDLRYNLGGYAGTALFLSSILAPESAVKNKSVYLEHYYNNLFTEFFRQSGDDLKEYFIDTLTVNMNLNHLYVLTTDNTASASEATMVGLKPYLNLTQIGEKTAGKYCGGILIDPELYYGKENKSYYANFSNWGMYVMIYRFYNVNGIESFTGGLVPDIEEEENPLDLKPFGDKNDPLLAVALARITNRTYITERSRKESLPMISLPGVKRFNGMIIDSPLLPKVNSITN